jgi:hypothetical protein
MRLEDVYDPEEEQGRLARILFPRYVRMLEAIHQLVASVFPWLSPDEFRVDDPATRKQLALAAEQVVGIDATTRGALRDVLREGQRRGYSAFQLAEGVPAEGFGGIKGLYLETWKGRAELIARTEMATAQLAASKDRYKATGLVSRIQIVEHEDTDAPCAAMNGRVFPVEEAPGLEHPNCRRGYVPIVDDVA